MYTFVSLHVMTGPVQHSQLIQLYANSEACKISLQYIVIHVKNAKKWIELKTCKFFSSDCVHLNRRFVNKLLINNSKNVNTVKKNKSMIDHKCKQFTAQMENKT